MTVKKRPALPAVDKKEALLKAALELFTRKGYAATSVREIVDAAGVTKPVLYYYFEHKEGIYLALMEQLFSRLEPLREAADPEGGSCQSLLLDKFDRAFRVIHENSDLFRLMHAIYYGPPQGAPFFDFDSYHARFHDHIARIVAQGIAAGEFRAGDPVDISWALMGASQVAIEEQLFGGHARIDRARLRRILNVIFEGVSA
jgi:TetR/AcrR family transcriptional regulator